MENKVQIIVVGAGPYGLSLASYLRAQNVSFRIFGHPMHTWIHQMPKGMHLKSEGFASTLYDPGSGFTLEEFCRRNSLPYADVGLPVPLGTFVSYGLEFQRRVVPELESKMVVSLERYQSGFRVELDSGENVFAGQVVIAVGISHFQYMPPVLRDLPGEYVSHSSQHNDLTCFRNRDVTVIGAGASALDVAALLKEEGACVRVIARQREIHFHNPPGPLPRPWLDRVRAPMTGLGPGWRSWLCVRAPHLFHYMPLAFRLKVVRRHLGPAPAWFVKDAVVGHVELNMETRVTAVRIDQGRVHLSVEKDGQPRSVVTDHVIAGTGYRVDLQRLSFLSPELQSSIRSVDQVPVLSRRFESSVQGLYFAGAAAAPSFGPLLRFAYGAGFTARRLSKHLIASARRARTFEPAEPPAARQSYPAR
jgi:cation diffusion facilitator CzcD-associated flavoprotein CzcO